MPSPGLYQQQALKQVIGPQMQQSLQILQAAALELRQIIQQEMAVNPVIEVDTKTGEQRVVTKLNPLSEQTLHLSLAGSYNVALDTPRDRLFVGLNAGRAKDDPWGEVVLAIVDLGS